MTRSLRDIWHYAWTTILVEMTDEEVAWLARAHGHPPLLDKRRTTMIVSRVQILAGLFALLTPLWIIVDVAAFPREVWMPLVAARLVATAAFGAITLLASRMNSMHDAYRTLAMLFAVPTVFYLFSYQHMAQFDLHGMQAAFSTGYAFLPFVMMAGLAIFPLTLLENLAFITPLLAMQLLSGVLRFPTLDWPPFAAAFWLLLLIGGVAILAGLSQLAFIIVLVREAIRDSMTGCFSRQSGQELVELQFNQAARSNTPLAIAFIDLDHFKQINDNFGHEAGDAVLVAAAARIRLELRASDMLVRWGGEEFVLIMPNTTDELACLALERLRLAGLGKRPDGTPVTASIGIAERMADETATWRQLIEVADARMYEAKQTGRDRLVGCNWQACAAAFA
jgi:diguanylate cyclase (GGDEF)-like protein